MQFMTLKTVVFLLIVGAVLMLIGEAVSFFTILSTIAFCGAGIIFIVWLYQKFYGQKNQ